MIVTGPENIPFKTKFRLIKGLFKAGFTVFGIRKNCPINGSSLLLCQFKRKAIQLTVIIIVAYHCYQLHKKFYQITSRLNPHIYKKLLGIFSMGFDVTDPILFRSFAFSHSGEKIGVQ
jgi:hypothetical protein